MPTRQGPRPRAQLALALAAWRCAPAAAAEALTGYSHLQSCMLVPTRVPPAETSRQNLWWLAQRISPTLLAGTANRMFGWSVLHLQSWTLLPLCAPPPATSRQKLGWAAHRICPSPVRGMVKRMLGSSSRHSPSCRLLPLRAAPPATCRQRSGWVAQRTRPSPPAGTAKRMLGWLAADARALEIICRCIEAACRAYSRPAKHTSKTQLCRKSGAASPP
mmetsp:Transcript_32427/g.102952  ORF Transcript_32427/g.102952 Transcript_32427/m.102952 type:complete len:218 (-) Transcript_32427:82-735(-)